MKNEEFYEFIQPWMQKSKAAIINAENPFFRPNEETVGVIEDAISAIKERFPSPEYDTDGCLAQFFEKVAYQMDCLIGDTFSQRESIPYHLLALVYYNKAKSCDIEKNVILLRIANVYDIIGDEKDFIKFGLASLMWTEETYGKESSQYETFTTNNSWIVGEILEKSKQSPNAVSVKLSDFDSTSLDDYELPDGVYSHQFHVDNYNRWNSLSEEEKQKENERKEWFKKKIEEHLHKKK